MAEPGTEVFHAQISATDDASKTIEQIRQRFHSLGGEADHVGHATEHMHKPHIWAALGEHINLTREHFGELHASIGEVGESITELLPAMAALGAVGTFAALFETAEKTAEAYAQLDHSAAAIGITADHLQDLRSVAYLTDTSVEALESGLNKLNKTIGLTIGGKNKDAAAMFEHLHISLRDTHGQVRDTEAVMFDLADAFEHTTTGAMRTRMATTAMGRGGVEMIPMLRMGRAELMRLSEESRGLEFKPSEEQRKKVLEFADEMKKLRLASTGVEEAMGATLAPAMTPLIEKAKEFLVEVRPEVQAAIARGGHDFVEFMQHVPWKTVGDDLRAVKHEVAGFIESIGGGTRAVEILASLMALKGVMFLAEPILAFGTFSAGIAKATFEVGTELAGAWATAGAAASAAAVEETAAAEAGVAAATAGARGALISAGMMAVLQRALPIAGGIAVHEADKDDHVGAFMDRNFKWAENADDWAARHTGGLVGHRIGWVEHRDSVARGRNYLAESQLMRHPVDLSDLALPQFGAPPAADPGRAFSPLFGSPLSAGPSMSLSPAPSLDGAPRSASEGSVQTTITIQGLTQFQDFSVSSSSAGIAAPPVVNRTGQGWADQYGTRAAR